MRWSAIVSNSLYSLLVCYHGNTKVVALLIEHGADVDRKNKRGQTPLSFATLFGYQDIVERLKGAGASVRLRDRGMMAVCVAVVSRIRN